MPRLRYTNPAAERHTIRVRSVAGRKPLEHGRVYEVSEKIAAFLLARQPEHWSRQIDVDTLASIGDGDVAITAGTVDVSVSFDAVWLDDVDGDNVDWTAVVGIGEEIAQALRIGLGIHTRADLQREIAEHGLNRIKQVPGIGDSRAGRLAQFAEGD